MIRLALISAIGIWGATADAGITREQAAEFAADATLDIEAEGLLASHDERRAVLSAMLCEADERVDATEAALDRRLDRILCRSNALAYRDAGQAAEALAVLDMEPIPCGQVARLVECLGVASPASCDREHTTQVQMRAAAILTLAWAPKAKAGDL